MGKRRKTKKNSDASAAKSHSGGATLSATAESKSVKTLNAGEEILFVGRAWLEVLSGQLELNGRIVGGQQPSKQLLTADEQLFGPLSIAASGPTPARFVVSGTEEASDADDFGFLLSEGKTGGDLTQHNEYKDWTAVIDKIFTHYQESDVQTSPICLTAGSRNLGKSTFNRLLVNKLLNAHSRVAYLDTDLGQPEFTVPGLVSLSILSSQDAILGPPYMHQRRPEYSYFLGDVSPESDPLKVIEAVKGLHACWQKELLLQGSAGHSGSQMLPLVVNTNGWIQGVGLEVLTGILLLLDPSHVVFLTSPNERRNLPAYNFWNNYAQTFIATVPGLHTVAQPPISPEIEGQGGLKEQKSWSAVDLRSLAWLDFANRCVGQPFQVSSGTGPRLSSKLAIKMAEEKPWEISFSNIKIQMCHTSADAEHLSAALNCVIVGLAKQASSANCSLYPCIGTAIVRAVDASQGCLYLLTDVDSKDLENVNVLQVGKLSLPQSLLQTQQLSCPYMSFWSISQSKSGAGVLKSRNNLKRASQH